MNLRNVALPDDGHTSDKQCRGKSLAPLCLQGPGPLHTPNGNGYLVSNPLIASHCKITKQGIAYTLIP